MKKRNLTAVLATAFCVGCGGGSSTPSGPSQPADSSRASFTLNGAGYSNVGNNFSAAGGNLIFCRQETPGPNTIWVRLAQSGAANGDNSPHIDIDLCNFSGTSTYTVLHDTTGDRTCSQGASFGIWWHDGSREFASQPGVSAPCTVSVTRGSGTIEGTFECTAIPSHTGTSERVDVSAGSFRCNF